MNTPNVEDGLRQYEEHLLHTAEVFNGEAAAAGLGVRMNPERALAAVKSGVGLAKAAQFWSRTDDSGIVHDSQLVTAIKCIVEMLQDGKRCGHVVGAMQSGKTTTSLALQWAGPILYLLRGYRAYPFYIIGNQLNHEDQTKTELHHFVAYYGDVDLSLAEGVTATDAVDPVFQLSPSLSTYRERVLRRAEDFYAIPQLADIVHRRVGGDQSLNKIVELCQRAKESGFRPLMIIDEPQFGASDRFIERKEGGKERRECVLARIFTGLEQALDSTRDDHWFVGLSATPFEMNDLQRFWEVRQSLTQDYSGFNFFNESPISEGVDIIPPETLSLTDFAERIGIEFIAKVSMAAYDGRTTFDRHARRIGYDKDQDAYRTETENALRSAIYTLLDQYAADSAEPVGLCLRAFNDNRKTQALMARLALDPERIEVVEYYGNDTGGFSVKRAIGRRKRPDLPYLVLVTNRARMADAFPKQVRFFMDLAQKASDLNALLQGLLGRACGYDKRSTVVLSDTNAGIVRAYVATSGGYVHKTSRHSMTVGGGFRRGAPTGMLKLRTEMKDETVQHFFDRINSEVVQISIRAGAKMHTERTKKGGYRMAPILRIAEELSLFEHVEDPAVRATLYPELVTGFRVTRRGEKIRHSRTGAELTYEADAAGRCRFTFRHSSRSAAAQGGAAGRAKGKKDSNQHIEPTIYVEKYDPITKATIEDEDTPGEWRAFMVTFPLREPVREVHVADVAYPIETSPFSDFMTDEEKAARDAELERRAAQ